MNNDHFLETLQFILQINTLVNKQLRMLDLGEVISTTSVEHGTGMLPNMAPQKSHSQAVNTKISIQDSLIYTSTRTFEVISYRFRNLIATHQGDFEDLFLCH